jgi:hypothetical protein
MNILYCLAQLCPLIQVGASNNTFVIVYRQFEIFHYINIRLIILYLCVCLSIVKQES